MSGKRYTDEFKIEAVKQVTERGHSVGIVSLDSQKPVRQVPVDAGYGTTDLEYMSRVTRRAAGAAGFDGTRQADFY
ncbi:TPA: transposase [Burkholderia aenigmatica]|nr:transposase [Burkholderia aenigmatica]HDR9514331.1 transposase [Burkholderia aenigmatica]HDR9591721.1 transposase [Burkholderia aenigmatica]HDR9600961.1 transposase [Burkholderia aenigmatica]HDR9607570.1 transposase [Burkholderia aenigmatica]